MGSVLSQREGDGEKGIAYASKTFSRTQTRYCKTHRELLAIVTFVKHFHNYLCGQPFTIITDHASLTWHLNFKEPEGMVARWLVTLVTYDFQIVHRPGSSMGNADALSRKVSRPCRRAEFKDCTPSTCSEQQASQQSTSNHSDVAPTLSNDSLLLGEVAEQIVDPPKLCPPSPEDDCPPSAGGSR